MNLAQNIFLAYAVSSAITAESCIRKSQIALFHSSYLVKIPLQISNLVENGYSFTAQSINILDNEVVRVYAENTSIEMTNERGDTCTLNLSSDGANGEMGSFRNGENASTIRMTGQMGMDARAGSYTGKATFSVRLENVRQ